MLYPTRFVVDATENSKEGGVAAEVCSSQAGLSTKNHKATYYCSYVGHLNEVTFVGVICERRPKSDSFIFIRLFTISTWERSEGEGGTKRGPSCRELPKIK